MVFGCNSLKTVTPETEFRGVWVASVVNIDWPQNGKDPVSKQKADFEKILAFYKDLNFNSVIVQVRTAGDALYPSEMAPWSRFLTGEEGKPKDGFENALSWMVERTHEEGMQFHAWLNPYRATFDLDTTILADTHDFYQRRDWMVKYGQKYYYNPGIPQVWKHLSKVVHEVVGNYDIDGVHFDDYFYPYKISGETFNDSTAYQKHKLAGQSLGDWRRANVDSLVKNVHRAIKAQKPWLRFGISPFGVWKNKTTDPQGSDTKAGQTTYEDLYADPLVWMEHGWLDYIVPQAYWSMEFPAASHKKIAQWWANKSQNTNLYMGNGPYKIRNNADKAWDKKLELPKQIVMARNNPNIKGNVYFSSKSLQNQNGDVVKLLKKKFYSTPIALPKMKLKSKRVVNKPVLKSKNILGSAGEFCISHFDSLPRFLLLKDFNRNHVLKRVYIPANESSICFNAQLKKKQLSGDIGLLVEDAFGVLSDMEIVQIKK